MKSCFKHNLLCHVYMYLQVQAFGTYAVEKSDLSLLKRVLSKMGFKGLKEKKRVCSIALIVE